MNRFNRYIWELKKKYWKNISFIVVIKMATE